jgi:hypothetical protein
MKNKFLTIGLAMSSVAFGQDYFPNIEDISDVKAGYGGRNFVVTLQSHEIYTDTLDFMVERDTFYVNPKYKIGDLIPEDDWESGEAFRYNKKLVKPCTNKCAYNKDENGDTTHQPSCK